jgi:hypothetical protein
MHPKLTLQLAKFPSALIVTSQKTKIKQQIKFDIKRREPWILVVLQIILLMLI